MASGEYFWLWLKYSQCMNMLYIYMNIWISIWIYLYETTHMLWRHMYVWKKYGRRSESLHMKLWTVLLWLGKGIRLGWYGIVKLNGSSKKLFIYLFIYCGILTYIEGFPSDPDDKESAFNVGSLGSIPGSERSSGGQNSNWLQYSCLENSFGQRSLVVTVHGVMKSQTRLSD